MFGYLIIIIIIQVIQCPSPKRSRVSSWRVPFGNPRIAVLEMEEEHLAWDELPQRTGVVYDSTRCRYDDRDKREPANQDACAAWSTCWRCLRARVGWVIV